MSCIYVLDLDEQTGEPCSEPRVFYQFNNTDVDPDGCVTDQLGNLWLAVWRMGCVMCLSPGGELIKAINNTVSGQGAVF